METNQFKTCIVGQGLAGTTLAWILHRQGHSVAVIDRNEKNTSSRIAAGLITPVTGKRFVKCWRFDGFWPKAKTFYKSIEKITETNFFHQQHSVRLFSSQKEQEIFLNKSDQSFPELVRFSDNLINNTNIDNSNHGFEMLQAARLDIPKYLDVSQEYFIRQNMYFTADIDPSSDIHIKENSVEIQKTGLRTKQIIFCQGFSGSTNHWFDTINFDAVKGEILTVKIKGLNEQRVIHRGIWIASIGNDLYRVGATYDRDNLNTIPTILGRDYLCDRLAEFIKTPFEIIEHQAGVRPVIIGRKPVIGFHPKYPRLGYFNGLGSKGSLQAPWFAQTFSDSIINQVELSSEFDISQHLNIQNQP